MLSRFSRELKKLVSQEQPKVKWPWKDEGKRIQMKTAAAVTAGAATAATLALCVPILGVLLTKTGSGAVAGYLGHLFRKRSRLRDSSTAGDSKDLKGAIKSSLKHLKPFMKSLVWGCLGLPFRKLSSRAAPDC